MVVTFLTDFGTADTFAGQMKGVLLGIAPGTSVVDLTHAVPPQDVRAGAFQLWSAVEAFPEGSIHVAVVDPGVGTSRRALAIRSKRGDFFVGPDNGLLLPAVDRLGGVSQCVALTNPTYWRVAEPSATFHGRDIFAPAAGHLAVGVALSTLGTAVTDPQRSVALPQPRLDGTDLVGEVVHVDAFGNLLTSFRRGDLPKHFRVWVSGAEVKNAPHASYHAVAPGKLLAILGSAGLLEISVRDGSAAKATGAKVGDQVIVFTADSDRTIETHTRARAGTRKS